jgi:hypothetical protein
MLITLLIATMIALAALGLALRIGQSNRALRRALTELAAKTGEPLPVVTTGWLPRFGLKSLLVTTTLLALAVGLFGRELARARQQDQLLVDFEIADLRSGSGSLFVEAEYSMGLFGTGALAQLLTEHCHPSFGCEVSRLSLVSEYRSGQLDCDERSPSSSSLERIGKLRELEALQIVGVRFSDELAASVARLKRLRHLSLQCCDLPPGTLDLWGKTLRLESLELRKCGLDDKQVEGLQQMVGLRDLVLTDDAISDAGLIPLGSLSNLRTLDLSRNNITGAGLECLFSLERLEQLRLLGISLVESDLGTIVNLPRLREVNLYSGKSRARLRAIEQLFADRPEVKVLWPADNDIYTWGLIDNRPGQSSGGFGWGCGVLPISAAGN